MRFQCSFMAYNDMRFECSSMAYPDMIFERSIMAYIDMPFECSFMAYTDMRFERSFMADNDMRFQRSIMAYSDMHFDCLLWPTLTWAVIDIVLGWHVMWKFHFCPHGYVLWNWVIILTCAMEVMAPPHLHSLNGSCGSIKVTCAVGLVDQWHWHAQWEFLLHFIHTHYGRFGPNTWTCAMKIWLHQIDMSFGSFCPIVLNNEYYGKYFKSLTSVGEADWWWWLIDEDIHTLKRSYVWLKKDRCVIVFSEKQKQSLVFICSLLRFLVLIVTPNNAQFLILKCI